MKQIEKFKVVVMKNDNFVVADNVYVYRLKYVYQNGKCKYKLVKQCRNIQQATDYISANM